MIILALDTSIRSGSIAVLNDDVALGFAEIGGDEPYSASIPRDVNALLSRHRIALKHIDLFAVAAGPGSFTGLRVGLTAIKAWAELFAKPIAAVSVLEAIAVQVPPYGGPDSSIQKRESGDLIAGVLDAHRGQVFGALFRRLTENETVLEAVSQDVLASAGEFVEFVRERTRDGRVVFATPAPDVIRPTIEHSPLKAAPIVQVSGIFAPLVGHLGYRRALREDVSDALSLDANYVRRPDAEAQWKES